MAPCTLVNPETGVALRLSSGAPSWTVWDYLSQTWSSTMTTEGVNAFVTIIQVTSSGQCESVMGVFKNLFDWFHERTSIVYVEVRLHSDRPVTFPGLPQAPTELLVASRFERPEIV